MSKNIKQKSTIYEEYLEYYEKFKNKYGDKAVVLMQVGSFHEAYATETRGSNLFKLSELLNVVCTRKDKSIDKIDEKNPYMLGFPSVALSKFLKILVDNQYTVIIIDQTTPPPNPMHFNFLYIVYKKLTFLNIMITKQNV
jgi:DNA mismatch repair protein MutS